MRYAVALLVAACVIAAVCLFVWQTQRQLREQIRQALQQERDGGRVPPVEGTDAALANGRDFNLKVPAGQQARIDLARMLASTWYVWSPLVIALCLCSAAIVGWIRNRPEN